MAKKNRRKTISQYFSLKKTQYDLDFFDCYISYDTPLFIDPWAIRCGDDDFSVNCYQKIQSVFERLLHFIKNKDKVAALDLLNNLHEPSETGLGYSAKTKKGSSVGPEKALDIYEALQKSKAVKTGLLQDLEDTALHIEGVGADNISDIITNIIRYELIKYTQEQCLLYGIPMQVSQTKTYWDEVQKDFVQKNNEDMLIVEGKKILLVPKKVLRRSLAISYTDFYKKGILEFEQARHLDMRTSLCRTLKKDDSLEKPYKKTLEDDERYHLSRELVHDYIEKHPELLDIYKEKKSSAGVETIDNKGILKKQKRDNPLKTSVEEKITAFKEIKAGKDDADKYHNHIFDCLSTIFNDPGASNYLNAPKKEEPRNQGRKKIDIKFHNSSNSGFFSRLSNYGGLFCAKIFFECKNYRHDLENPEYDQMTGRFNNREATVGFIVCRNIEDKEKCIATCRDFVRNKREYVIVLTDEDIINLLKATLSKNRDTLIDNILQDKLDEITSLDSK